MGCGIKCLIPSISTWSRLSWSTFPTQSGFTLHFIGSYTLFEDPPYLGSTLSLAIMREVRVGVYGERGRQSDGAITTPVRWADIDLPPTDISPHRTLLTLWSPIIYKRIIKASTLWWATFRRPCGVTWNPREICTCLKGGHINPIVKALHFMSTLYKARNVFWSELGKGKMEDLSTGWGPVSAPHTSRFTGW